MVAFRDALAELVSHADNPLFSPMQLASYFMKMRELVDGRLRDHESYLRRLTDEAWLFCFAECIDTLAYMSSHGMESIRQDVLLCANAPNQLGLTTDEVVEAAHMKVAWEQLCTTLVGDYLVAASLWAVGATALSHTIQNELVEVLRCLAEKHNLSVSRTSDWTGVLSAHCPSSFSAQWNLHLLATPLEVQLARSIINAWCAGRRWPVLMDPHHFISRWLASLPKSLEMSFAEWSSSKDCLKQLPDDTLVVMNVPQVVPFSCLEELRRVGMDPRVRLVFVLASPHPPAWLAAELHVPVGCSDDQSDLFEAHTKQCIVTALDPSTNDRIVRSARAVAQQGAHNHEMWKQLLKSDPKGTAAMRAQLNIGQKLLAALQSELEQAEATKKHYETAVMECCGLYRVVLAVDSDMNFEVWRAVVHSNISSHLMKTTLQPRASTHTSSFTTTQSSIARDSMLVEAEANANVTADKLGQLLAKQVCKDYSVDLLVFECYRILRSAPPSKLVQWNAVMRLLVAQWGAVKVLSSCPQEITSIERIERSCAVLQSIREVLQEPLQSVSLFEYNEWVQHYVQCRARHEETRRSVRELVSLCLWVVVSGDALAWVDRGAFSAHAEDLFTALQEAEEALSSFPAKRSRFHAKFAGEYERLATNLDERCTRLYQQLVAQPSGEAILHNSQVVRDLVQEAKKLDDTYPAVTGGCPVVPPLHVSLSALAALCLPNSGAS